MEGPKKGIHSLDFCCYKDCKNGRHTTGHHLYRFPKKESDGSLLSEWIHRSGNEKRLLNLSASSIRRAGLCSEHFRPEMFLPNPVYKKNARKRLKKDAVPILYNNTMCKEKEEENDIKASCSRAVEISIKNETTATEQQPGTSKTCPSPKLRIFESGNVAMEWLTLEPEISENVTLVVDSKCIKTQVVEKGYKNVYDENKRLKQEIFSLRQQLARVRASRDNLRMKLREEKSKDIDKFLDKYDCRDEVARTMIKLQLHKGTTDYTPEERELSKSMYYHSASAYNLLRKAGCHLPSESAIRRWTEEFDVEHRLCNRKHEKVKEKRQSTSHETFMSSSNMEEDESEEI